MDDVNRPDRSEALIARIEAETEAELVRIRAKAEAEAAAEVQAAHARARARVHEEIAALKRTRAEALRFETARLDTARRQLRGTEARAEIEAGLPALEAALAALWNEAETRMGWARAALRLGADRFGPGDWVVTHPGDLTPDEIDRLAREVKQATGTAPGFEPDPSLGAGLQVRAATAWLDASLAALIADREATGAALLAEIARAKEGRG
ncbi:hypothetical protein [Maritimibacter sp. HL-12]|uniref:hypothetical protein n=1 Tax=Maritimibacter sp. HL-12 TaxID=1162418 RepID=UPI000A0F1435|nr:hypothetical protein [Maritimibacter sp. HL-12]SMH54132.1 SWI/SNF-related matrix-associated actin-dependent regulator of chromatin subfamily A containing DEAD/H box 1 [Maritimibacter sp. HL-12]